MYPAARFREMEHPMKKKFVQIVSLALACLMIVSMMVSGSSGSEAFAAEGGDRIIFGGYTYYVDESNNIYYIDESGTAILVGMGYVDANGMLVFLSGGPIESVSPDDTVDSLPDAGSSGDIADISGTETVPVTPGTASGEAGNPVLRLGIYYGSAGKQAVDLQLTTGTGFRFGYYSDDACEVFVPLASAECTRITVTALSGSGIVVSNTSTGDVLYQHDESSGVLLAIEPYSTAGEKTVTKCGYPYYGAFRFERFSSYDDRLTIVNIVCMDDYLKGVVPYEASASWPIEALKAQAVCARSYALTHINSSHRKNYHFDLCDTDCCQVYKGVYSGSNASKTEAAVDATSGITIQYNGEYCDAVYSSSNGGGSEDAANVWGKEVAYLKGKTDPYEATIADTIPNYSWSVNYTGAELQAKLIASGYVSCGVIQKVKTTLSDTGNVIALTFIDQNGKSWTIYNTSGSGGSKCRTLLSLRSLHYTVSSEDGQSASASGTGELLVNGNDELDMSSGIAVISGSGTVSSITGGYVITADGVTEIGAAGSGGDGQTVGASGSVFTFTGTGWGHNVGMSQYGACAMAQLGYTYQQILEFYYTGVTVG